MYVRMGVIHENSAKFAECTIMHHIGRANHLARQTYIEYYRIKYFMIYYTSEGLAKAHGTAKLTYMYVHVDGITK